MAYLIIFLSLSAVLGILEAAEISIPLTIRFDLLRQKFTKHVYTDPDDTARVWDQSKCQFLTLDKPEFSDKDGHLRFVTHGAGTLGAKVLEQCLIPLQWRGYIEAMLQPEITPDWQLRLRILDSNLYDEQWNKRLLSGLLWDITKQFVHPKLTGVRLDLAPPRDEVLSLVKVSVAAPAAPQVKAILESAVPKNVAVRDNGVQVSLALNVPDHLLRAPPPPKQPEPPLSPAEIETYQQALARWDAFLVFVIKGIGRDLVDPDVRGKLFDLLLTSRYRVLSILAGNYTKSQGDPVRRLFVEAWKGLHEIVQDSAQRGLLGDKLLRYVGFLDAGDALMALEQAAPGLGIEISTDGLRRLARMLRPEAIEDPLKYNLEVDPSLRTLFGLPTEIPIEAPETSAPQSSLSFLPGAYAAMPGDDGFGVLKKRLDRWVPDASEFAQYIPVMQKLLEQLTGKTLQIASLDRSYHSIYQPMIPATALKESCWRQFVRKQDKITFLKSPSGSLGLMQINPQVWRGFYNVEQLKWNTAYNGHAGAEILMQYFKRYGIDEGKQTGQPENAARATYAVYNAGPTEAKRYRVKNSTGREKQVDRTFWDMYRGFANQGKPNLQDCSVATHPD